MGKSPKRAALDSAMEIPRPVLVAIITTPVVFFLAIFLFKHPTFLRQFGQIGKEILLLAFSFLREGHGELDNAACRSSQGLACNSVWIIHRQLPRN